MRYYARAFPPSGGPLGGSGSLFTWFVRARDWYFALPRLKFEALTAGLALAVGLLVMPALIFVAGRYTLREYGNGGLFALYFDYLKGLVEGRASCWFVLAGPLLFLSLFRVFRMILRKL